MSISVPTRKLTVADIDDIRAYERIRETFRTEMIALRDRRRVSVGTMVSLVFENRQTIRFQIQEMARVEGITTDHIIERLLKTIPLPQEQAAAKVMHG